MKMKRAVYPGTFWPFTNGHLSIYKKAADVFGQVIVLFALNPDKPNYAFHTQHNIMKAVGEIVGCNNVAITDGFVVEWCQDSNIHHVIRGLRNPTDYFYEENIRKVNKLLAPEIETVYFTADEDAISSSLIRTLYHQGKDIRNYVPGEISEMISREGL